MPDRGRNIAVAYAGDAQLCLSPFYYFFKIRILCTLITLFYDSTSVVVQYLVFTVNLTKPVSGYKKKFSCQSYYIVNKSKSLNEIFLRLLVYFEVKFTADAYVVVVRGK